MRFSAPSKLIERFSTEIVAKLPPFVLYGSGDFHHLSALFVRRVSGPVTVISFDNHPDWDIRPPRWCCGGWVNRALELDSVRRISVWGCGNFECWWPAQIFGNRSAEREGRLEVHPWADARAEREKSRRGAILRGTWKTRFAEFLPTLRDAKLYITIDLDCLVREAAITNWENGRFTLDDVAWALAQLRSANLVIAGGDICGAFSKPVYARCTQRFIAGLDHPKLPTENKDDAARLTLATLEKLWPLLAE